VYRQ